MQSTTSAHNESGCLSIGWPDRIIVVTTEDSHRADLEAQAKRLNAEYGAAGDDERYAIVVRGTDGKLLVEQRRENGDSGSVYSRESCSARDLSETGHRVGA